MRRVAAQCWTAKQCFAERKQNPEKGGFEPPVVSQLRRFSKPMQSTTLPPFLAYFKNFS